MMKLNKKKEKQAVDIENIDIDGPTVDIGEKTGSAEGISLLIGPIDYRTKKLLLKKLSLQLKNEIVAYDGPTVYRIQSCIDFFYHSDPDQDGDFRKAFATALASYDTCVILADVKKDLYVCSLDRSIWYQEVHTTDDFSNRYGGLTRLETRSKKPPADMNVLFIITSEGHVLTPIKNDADYIEDNAYFFRVRESLTGDLATYLLYVAKTGELETHVTGFA